MMKMVKKFLFYLLVFLSCVGCRASKTTTTTEHSRDSITVVHTRPVELSIPADTASTDHNLTKFTKALHDAPVGAVIEEKVGTRKTAAYRIIKVAQDSIRIEARTIRKDTTIYVHDTITVVKDRLVTNRVTVKEPGFWNSLKTRLTYMGLGILIIIVVLLVWHIQRRINL